MFLMRRLCTALFSVLLLACVNTGAAHATIETEAKYAFLTDVETQTVLFEKNADELMAPASMSKLMTLAVVFEALEKGRITMETEFPVSLHAWRDGGAPSRTSAMFAPLNTKVKVSDLLQGVIVQSGNDACIILAEGLAGSEEAFVDMMTDYARKIGLKKSTFGNSSGLPNPKQLMTARELAKLAKHIIQRYPQYYPMFAEKKFNYRKHVFYNRDPLLYAKVGADGLKTGYTKQSGYGLVGSAVQDGRRLIVVLNGISTKARRKKEAVRMVNWGFRNFEKFTLFGSGDVVAHARVWGGQQFHVKLRGINGGPVTILLPRNARTKKLHGELFYLGPVKAPVEPGQRIGELRVTASGGISASTPLEAAEPVGTAGIIRQGLDSAFHLAFGWLIHRQKNPH
jgi:D-alanyl-D-alanine carboxypeptidase (penicillin-binding protein 5/6)